MLLVKREADIVAFVNERGAVSVHELSSLFDVTDMTIRRDLRKLEMLRLLRRTRGGAVRLEDAAPNTPLGIISSADAVYGTLPDALILAPVQDRAAHTLRERALRSRIPLIAEGAPQEGAVYVGPENFQATKRLGHWTAQYVRQHLSGRVCVLDIGLPQLPNTVDRSAGFSAGLRAEQQNAVQIVSVDGRGLYNDAYQAALDALRVHPEIDVIFGINDDSVLGGVQAYLDLGRDPSCLVAVNVGGEGKTLFDVLWHGGPIKACMALFPEIVGRMAVDTALRLWADEAVDNRIVTPTALLTGDNLTQFYTPSGKEWVLNTEAVAQLEQSRYSSPVPVATNKRLVFAFHYHTHEWYENVTRAMRERAGETGVALTVSDVNEDVKAEINELRRLVGKGAAAHVKDGESIILDTGTATSNMAQFLQGHRDLTVVTNSVGIFQRLQQNPNINLRLTGGDYHRSSQSLVGRGAQRFLADIRVDKAFIVAGGVSAAFGVSCANLPEADVRRAMINAAREVVLLVDHTVFDIEANEHVADLKQIHTVITDSGTLAAQRLALNQRGIKVIVAGPTPDTEMQSQADVHHQ